MPDVGSYQFRGRDETGWKVPVSVHGYKEGEGWKRATNVYACKGPDDWVEVWNSAPEMVVTGFTASSTALSLTGTADPNTFATTARFDYRVVGTPTWTATGNTTSGMGNDVDTPVTYSNSISTSNPWQNWETRAVGTNTAGTGISATVQRDCRKHTDGGTGWTKVLSNYRFTTESCGADCQGCGDNTRLQYWDQYSKTGCPNYDSPGGSDPCRSCGTWVPETGNFTLGSYEYFYSGTPGYYSVTGISVPDGSVPGCTGCTGGCYRTATYYVEKCTTTYSHPSSGTRRGQNSPIGNICGPCQDVFGGIC